MIIAFKLTLTHEGGKEIVLSLGIKTDQVHASVPAKVASVEPVPILKLVPGLPPRQEVIVSAPLHVRDSCRWRTKSWVFSSTYNTLKIFPKTQCFIIRGKWLNSLYYLLFWHSSSTGLLSKGLPSGPILAGLWAKTADTVKANRLNCIRILRACSKDVKSFKKWQKKLTTLLEVVRWWWWKEKLDHLFILLQKKVCSTATSNKATVCEKIFPSTFFSLFTKVRIFDQVFYSLHIYTEECSSAIHYTL